jgi:hypothetical protein
MHRYLDLVALAVAALLLIAVAGAQLGGLLAAQTV